MPLVICCTAGHEFKVAENRAGTVVRCPRCREQVTVPKPGDPKPVRTPPKEPPPRSPVAKPVEPAAPPIANASPPPPPVGARKAPAAPSERKPVFKTSDPAPAAPSAAPKPSAKATEKRPSKSSDKEAVAKADAAREAARRKLRELNAKKEAPAKTPLVEPPAKIRISSEELQDAKPKKLSPAPDPPKFDARETMVDASIDQLQQHLNQPEPSKPLLSPEEPETKALPRKEAEKGPSKEPPREEPSIRDAATVKSPVEPAASTERKDPPPKPPEKESTESSKPPRLPPPRKPPVRISSSEVAASKPAPSSPAKPAASQRPEKPKPAPSPSQPEPEKEPEPKVRGYIHNPRQCWTAYNLAIALAVVGAFSLTPAVLEIVDFFRHEQAAPIARWAFAVILAGLLQLTYAAYVGQLPDWSTVWVGAVLCLVYSAVYATMVALFMWSETAVLTSLGISEALRNRAVLWCFSMLSLSSLITYFAGRAAARWKKAYDQTIELARG